MKLDVSPRAKWIAAGALAVLVAGWTYQTQYSSPREELLDRIDSTKREIAELESILDERIVVRKRLRETASETLGKKRDVVEHRFRSGLSSIGDREGLTGVIVSTGSPKEHVNPLAMPRAKGVPATLKKALRTNPDFETLSGQIKGKGTLEQSLRVIAALQSQPWIHRIDGFSLRPAGKDGDQIELQATVTTIVVADLVNTDNPLRLFDSTTAAEQLWKPIADKNVFRKPVPGESRDRPVEIRAAADPPPATGPIAPPYEEWKLTGVIEGKSGVEVFLSNVKTGSRVTIQLGGKVLDAVFIEAAGERAVFEIGGKRFEVNNGQTLGARRPIS